MYVCNSSYRWKLIVLRFNGKLNLKIGKTTKQQKKQNKILLITNISNYISFPPQIAYKLIEAGRSKDILQIKSLSIDGLNNRENTTIQYIE